MVLHKKIQHDRWTEPSSAFQRHCPVCPIKKLKAYWRNHSITYVQLFPLFQRFREPAPQFQKKKSLPKLHYRNAAFFPIPLHPLLRSPFRPFCLTNDQSLRFIFIAYPPPVPSSPPRQTAANALEQRSRCVIFLSDVSSFSLHASFSQ